MRSAHTTTVTTHEFTESPPARNPQNFYAPPADASTFAAASSSYSHEKGCLAFVMGFTLLAEDAATATLPLRMRVRFRSAVDRGEPL